MKITNELSKFDKCGMASKYTKHFLVMVVLGSVLLFVMPVYAITVDGYKSIDEWNESWFYGQDQASTYNANGPFGDRLVIRQGRYSGLYSTNLWYDTDPKNDSGSHFTDSMAVLGESSGSDIADIYAHYDFFNDTVYGLVTVYGIPGDHDGNGDLSTASASGDTGGTPGLAGFGLGSYEYWRLIIFQGSTSSIIELKNNDWTVSGNGFVYGDTDAKFTSDQSNSVYEISFANLSEYYSVAPGAVLAMELFAGSSGDTPGEDSATVFIRIPKTATIGDYVWSDINKNGIQDDGDSGISDVLVDLVLDGTIISTNTTDADGLYLFDNLVADCYNVVINSSNFESGNALKGHIASPANVGADDAIDSDGINNASGIVCVTPGEENLTIDFGYIPLPATIGDYVWSDTDADGLQNASESGISGVLVDLVLDGTIISTDTTDADGLYLFDNLVADCYNVVINSSNFESGNALKGHIASPANVGADDAIDSDGINNASGIVCVAPGEVNLTIDFGYIPLPATIGDYVWADSNNNGVQNVSEFGIPGVLVDLVLDGTIISTDITDCTGLYLFDNLVADCYNVVINSSNFESGGVLEGRIASNVNVGTDDTIDSDGINNASDVCVDPGDVNLTIDFGYYEPCLSDKAIIGDYVWADINQNGIQDNDCEPGIPCVVVDLVQDGSIISTTVTDKCGFYMFDVTVGCYTGVECYDVVINSSNFDSGAVLFGHTGSPYNVGINDEIDSDGINNIASLCVFAGDENPTIDFGYYNSGDFDYIYDSDQCPECNEDV